jgi:hypothetical protein
VVARGSEERSNRVCSNFLFDCNCAIDFEHLVEVNVFDLKLGVPIGIDVIRDRDRVCRRGSGCECDSSVSVRN